MLNLSRRTVVQTGAVATLLALPAKIAFSQPVSTDEDALTFMNSDPRFSDWVAILKYTGLAQYAATDSFTAFVPTNSALRKYPEVLPDALRERTRSFPMTTNQVIFVLSHIVRDVHPLSEIGEKTVVLTAISENPIMISYKRPGVYEVKWVSINQRIASAEIGASPIMTSNAILYPFSDVTIATA